MNKKDCLAKFYTNQADVFADIVNLTLFDGEEELISENVIELDTVIKRKRRDVLKKCILKNGATMIIGIENQSYVDPSMPIRILCYDAEIYEKQLREKRKENKKEKLRGGEFLSGIRYSDRFDAVSSIVFNLSTEKWRGKKDIKEMLSYQGNMNTYKIQILEPTELNEEMLAKCKSEVWKLLQVLKYSQERKEMIECLKRKEYEEVGEETAKMIEAFIGMKVKLKVEEGKVNMCRAMEELKKEWKQEGEMIGLEIGLEKGEKRGLKKEKINTAKRMIESQIADELILKCCQISKKELNKLKIQMEIIA